MPLETIRNVQSGFRPMANGDRITAANQTSPRRAGASLVAMVIVAMAPLLCCDVIATGAAEPSFPAGL